MNLVHIVALLAVAQFFFFCFQVGQARRKYGISAPAVTGHEMFERMFRVQMNTLEQLVGFLPALLIAAIYWPAGIIAVIGLVYLAGRTIYWLSYVKDPSSRSLGFLMTLGATSILLLAGFAGAILRTAS